MKFFNDYDIAMARQRHELHPVLSKATRLLDAVASDANENSDGWAHWPIPARACKQLMTFIETGDTGNIPMMEYQYRKAQGPIKAMYTRARMGQYGAFNYPEFPEVT